MKSFLCILTLFMLLLININADEQLPNGTIIGDIYATDIVAYIDEIPIKSYNIGGKTVIVVEDLAKYGFEVKWNNKTRQLSATTMSEYEQETISIEKSKFSPGTPVGEIYSTDIITIINGIIVPSYNIGGRTVVSLEDIGLHGNSKGFTVYDSTKIIHQLKFTQVGFITKWDAVNRTIKTTATHNTTNVVNTNLGDVELLEIVNKNYDNYFIGVYKVLEIDNPENEYAKQNPAKLEGYSALINYIDIIEWSIELGITNQSTFYEITDFLGFCGIEYTFKNNTINIISIDETQKSDIPLKILDYNLYNERRINSPIYSINSKITINGEDVIYPENECLMVVNDYANVFINVELLETILNTKLMR